MSDAPPAAPLTAGLRGGSVGERLGGLLAERARAARVVDVRVGLRYTAVALDGDRVGVAMTFAEGGGRCSPLRSLRPLTDRSAAELLALLDHDLALARSIGLACANALANVGHEASAAADVLGGLQLRSTDRVATVGRFGPLVAPLRKRARSLTIFERVPAPEGDVLPAEEALTRLPQSDVAIVTATAIATRTIDALLDAARACREVVVLGPSTPLLPEAFPEAVTRLAGVVVTDPAGLLAAVSEGGGTPDFKPYVRKISLGLPRPAARLPR